jgi:hypothetical protein
MICGAPPPNLISQLVVRTRNMIHSDSWLKHLTVSGAGGPVCPRQAARTIPEPYDPRTAIFTRELGTLIFMNSSMQPAWMVPFLRTSPWRRRCRTLPITTLLLVTRTQRPVRSSARQGREVAIVGSARPSRGAHGDRYIFHVASIIGSHYRRALGLRGEMNLLL